MRVGPAEQPIGLADHVVGVLVDLDGVSGAGPAMPDQIPRSHEPTLAQDAQKLVEPRRSGVRRGSDVGFLEAMGELFPRALMG